MNGHLIRTSCCPPTTTHTHTPPLQTALPFLVAVKARYGAPFVGTKGAPPLLAFMLLEEQQEALARRAALIGPRQERPPLRFLD